MTDFLMVKFAKHGRNKWQELSQAVYVEPRRASARTLHIALGLKPTNEDEPRSTLAL